MAALWQWDAVYPATSRKLNPTTGVMAAATYGHSVWVLDMP